MTKWYSKLVSESIYGIGINFSMLIGGVFSALLFPRILGVEEFGLFSVAFSVANLWLFLANFGLDDTVVKFISASLVKKNTEKYLRFFVKWKITISFASSILLFLLSDFIAVHAFNDPRLGVGLKFSSIYVLFYSLMTFYSNVFFALKKTKVAFYSNAAYHILRVLIPLALVFLAFNYAQLILGTALAAIAGVFILLIYLSKTAIEAGKSELDYAGIKKFIFYNSLNFFGSVLLGWMSSIIIGVFQNSLDAGIYRVAFMWVSAIGVIIPFSSTILFSFYAEKHEAEKKSEMESVFKHSLRYGLFASLLAIVLLALTSEFFIGFIYDPSYSASASLLIILSILSIELMLNQVVLPLLSGVGRVDMATKYALLLGLATSLFNIIGLVKYGLVGVAVSTVLVRMVSVIALTVYTKRLLGLKMEPMIYAKMTICSIITLIAFYPLKSLVSSFPLALAYCAGISLVFSLLAFASNSIRVNEIRKIILH